MITIPDFENKSDEIKFIVENKKQLEAQKKSESKKADGVVYVSLKEQNKSDSFKANIAISDNELNKTNELKVRAIINTTNIMDSHNDVHVSGLWKKSLSENKMIMHVREHQSQKFDYIISDGNDLIAYTKDYSFIDLGFNIPGNTEALVFDSTIKKERNPYMFEQYGKGYVRNHSVGMQYVKIVLAVQEKSEYYGAENEAWDKYFSMVANPEIAEQKGYFWAVTEAKVIEGSAVPMGSNQITPTQENNIKSEPEQSTQDKQIELLSSLIKTF